MHSPLYLFIVYYTKKRVLFFFSSSPSSWGSSFHVMHQGGGIIKSMQYFQRGRERGLGLQVAGSKFPPSLCGVCAWFGPRGHRGQRHRTSTSNWSAHDEIRNGYRLTSFDTSSISPLSYKVQLPSNSPTFLTTLQLTGINVRLELMYATMGRTSALLT